MKLLVALAIIVVAVGAVVSMQKSRNTNDEAEIRQAWERWAKAFRAHDIDGIMSMYSPEVVAYDFVPPLQYVGKDAYRKDYEEFVSQFDGPVDVEFRDMKVVVGGDVAYIYALEHFTGKMKNGQNSISGVDARAAFAKSTENGWTCMTTALCRLILRPAKPHLISNPELTNAPPNKSLDRSVGTCLAT